MMLRMDMEVLKRISLIKSGSNNVSTSFKHVLGCVTEVGRVVDLKKYKLFIIEVA